MTQNKHKRAQCEGRNLKDGNNKKNWITILRIMEYI